MAYLTKAEFATLCGVETNYISVGIARGNVILGSDHLIDTDNDRNVLYMEKRRGVVKLKKNKQPKKPKPIPPPREPKVVKPTKGVVPRTPKAGIDIDNVAEDYRYPDGEDEIDEDGIPSLLTSEKRLKYHDVIKRQKEIQKLELDIEKKKGEVIPSGLVMPILTRQNMSMVTAFKNACDAIIIKYTKIRDLTVNEIADIRSYFLEAINESSEKANIETEKALSSIIDNYSEKRTVGEKN